MYYDEKIEKHVHLGLSYVLDYSGSKDMHTYRKMMKKKVKPTLRTYRSDFYVFLRLPLELVYSPEFERNATQMYDVICIYIV